MDYLSKLLLTIVTLFFVTFTIPFEEIKTAFAKGNAEKVMEYSANKILISIDGNEGVFSKSQGTQVLNNFFKSNPPSTFNYTFKGKEEANSFAVGVYQSRTKYQFSLKLKRFKDGYQIESLTIISISK